MSVCVCARAYACGYCAYVCVCVLFLFCVVYISAEQIAANLRHAVLSLLQFLSIKCAQLHNCSSVARTKSIKGTELPICVAFSDCPVATPTQVMYEHRLKS
jgi:hypothetical protein